MEQLLYLGSEDTVNFLGMATNPGFEGNKLKAYGAQAPMIRA